MYVEIGNEKNNLRNDMSFEQLRSLIRNLQKQLTKETEECERLRIYSDQLKDSSEQLNEKREECDNLRRKLKERETENEQQRQLIAKYRKQHFQDMRTMANSTDTIALEKNTIATETMQSNEVST